MEKTIYYFAYSNFDTPSVRYRGLYPLEEIKRKHHLDFEILYPSRKIFFRIILSCISIIVKTFLCKQKPVVIFQKIFREDWYSLITLSLAYCLKQKYYYDLDDAMQIIYEDKIMKKYIRHARAVFVGANSLMGYVKKFNNSAHLLTTPVPTSSYIKKEKNKIFNIGWIGIFTVHKKDLIEMLFPVLIRMDFHFKLSLLGVTRNDDKQIILDYFKKRKNIDLYIPLVIDWKNESAVSKELAQFDVGISPLSNNEINRAKSAFKSKQYLSCHVPVLASDVGENSVFIKDNVNGFLCRSKEDFEKYITMFLKMPSKEYKKFSDGDPAINRSFSVDVFCERLMYILSTDYGYIRN